MGHRQMFMCLFLLALMPLGAKAFPPASPAGGNYLVLDGVDDYAVLDFETFGRLLPDGTDAFTFEAWIYPTASPDKDTVLMILHQQVGMVIVNNEGQFNELANVVNTDTGYIDEVRISTEARYDVEKKGFTPRGKFKDDAKTVALWHFDEPSGTQEFLDASRNGHHLAGKNGAKIGIPLAVEAAGKLAITWGRLKQ